MEMKMSRGHDVYQVASVYEAFGGRKPGKLIFIGNFQGNGVIGVVKSYQFCYFYFFPIVEVKFSEVTNSKNAYFQHLLNFIQPQTYIKMMNRQSIDRGQYSGAQ